MEIIKKIMSGIGVLLVIAALIFIIVSNAKSGRKDSPSIPKNVGETAESEDSPSKPDKKRNKKTDYASTNSSDESEDYYSSETDAYDYATPTDGEEYVSNDGSSEDNPHIKSSGKQSLFKSDLGSGTAANTNNKSTAASATNDGTNASNTNQSNSDQSQTGTNTGVDTSDDIPLSEDIEGPEFLIFTKSPRINVGSAFNVHDFMGYGDNLDRDIEMTVSGSVDTLTIGSYPVTITLKDDAGNVSKSDMTVAVVSSGGYEPNSGDDLPASKPGTDSFSEFKNRYKGDGRTFGIDVSRWQGDIDFQKVKAAGCDYVIMRIGGYDDGELYTDRCYEKYLKDAKAAGLKIGVYWHAEEKNPQEVKNSVAYMKKVLNGEKLDFPIAYDWEDWENFENYGMNFKDINKNYKTFYNEVTAMGYDACLYSSLNFLENVWTNEMHSKVWLAHYTKQTDYTGSYFMWQQTSSGAIDGVSSCVDFNICYE
jgi:GH25 family lysozyme M1 (1,4-beta-N-acetylmuramidase)